MQGRNEEQKVYTLADEAPDVLRVYNNIPYALINMESGPDAEVLKEELSEICLYYKVYRKGKNFHVEGTNGDYVPANLKYKMAASLIKKEARFLFAEHPDIKVEPKGDVGKVTDDSKVALAIMNDLLETVLDKNNFSDILLKAARDCFIGKRVGGLVNFNEEDGITITFLPSFQFIYETKLGNPNVITKFVCFIIAKDSINNVEKRIFKKKFTLEDDGFAYIEESIYNGAGELVEVVTEKQPTKLTFIPAFVVINDGLSGEKLGESEVQLLMDYEMWYSKLANADSDAERKSMNPTKYVVDMENNSTKNLSTAAGALWDLGSDQNLEEAKTQVGMLEPRMYYSDALKTSLERIKSGGYDEVDVPNITTETMSGVITSGKALKAIYWPLIVRCKEKMTVWGPALQRMADIIIKGAIEYPNCIRQYTNDVIVPVAYEISVTQNTPLPEDEIEQKTTNLAEVEAAVMSKKTYMKMWYGLTDDEVTDELMQIAWERQVLEESSFNNGYNGDNHFMNPGDDEFITMGINAIKPDGTDKRGGKETEPADETQEISGDVDDSVSSFSNTGSVQRQGYTFTQRPKQLGATQTMSMIRVVTSVKNGQLSVSQGVDILVAMGLSETFARKLLSEQLNTK